MNQPTTYEELIARKLRELAVPEQADAIWATIEHQLNVEMPGNDHGPGGGGHSNWWMGGGGLLTIFVAVVTYISISNQQFENHRNIRETPAVQHPKPVRKGEKPRSDTTGNNPVRPEKPSGSRRADPVAVPQPATRDTISAIPAAAAERPELPVQRDTVPVQKKPRGVRGITDADYRLVPAPKDSLRKKNGGNPDG